MVGSPVASAERGTGGRAHYKGRHFCSKRFSKVEVVLAQVFKANSKEKTESHLQSLNSLQKIF